MWFCYFPVWCSIPQIYQFVTSCSCMPSVQYCFFFFILLPSSLFHELIISFCSLPTYFRTSFSFTCFSHCLFFVCLDLFFPYSVYLFSFPLLHFIICVFLFFSVYLFLPRCVGCLFPFPLFLSVFVSSPVSIYSLRVCIFCRVFSLSVSHSFFICLFISLCAFPCVFNFFMSLFSPHYLFCLSVFLSPCEVLCRPPGHV